MDLSTLPLTTRHNEAAEDFAQHIQQLHAEIRRKLALSAQSYKAAADPHRRHFEFQVDDLVMVRILPFLVELFISFIIIMLVPLRSFAN